MIESNEKTEKSMKAKQIPHDLCSENKGKSTDLINFGCNYAINKSNRLQTGPNEDSHKHNSNAKAYQSNKSLQHNCASRQMSARERKHKEYKQFNAKSVQ